MRKIENKIIKFGEFDTTPEELALLPFDTLEFMSEHSENTNAFYYHLLIHKDCPEEFFRKKWERVSMNITNGRLRMLKHVKIINNTDIITFILRYEDKSLSFIQARYTTLKNDTNSSFHAIFTKNLHVSTNLKYQFTNDTKFLSEEAQDIFIF